MASTEAELISRLCPGCDLNLTFATYYTGMEMQVLDIAELMAVSAGIVPGEILDPDYIAED